MLIPFSLNKVQLIGNLGRDPDVRSTQDGQKIVNLSIATSERWTDKQSGEKRERTEWHRVVIFNENIANVAERYLRKGHPVYIEGRLQTRKWVDDAGVERYSTEVVLQRYRGELTLLGGGGNSGLNDPDAMTQHQQGAPVTGGAGSSADDPNAPPPPTDPGNDDIPY